VKEVDGDDKQQSSAATAAALSSALSLSSEQLSLYFSSMSSLSSSSMSMSMDDLYKRNFFYRAWNNSISINNSNGNGNGNDHANNNNNNNKRRRKTDHLPKPMKVLIQYISQHSNQQLEKEWKECEIQQQNESQSQQKQKQNITTDIDCPTLHNERQYIVATYSCPIESGNRLHRYMNGLLWAVLTNRTFLWRYETFDICNEYNEVDCLKEYNPDIIKGSNIDCIDLIDRSNWIPSYDEWKIRLGIKDNKELIKAELFDGKKTYDNTTLPYDNDNDNNNADNNFIIRTGKQVNLNPGSILTKEPLNKTKHLSKPQNLQRLKELRSSYDIDNGNSGNNGVYFLYGMLFESMFTINSSLDPSNELLAQHAQEAQSKEEQSNDIETIFLHSRHAGHFQSDYIWADHLCLEKLFPKIINNETSSGATVANETTVETTVDTTTVATTTASAKLKPCHIYLMSDQPITVQLLHEEIRKTTRCTSSSTSMMPKLKGKNNDTSSASVTDTTYNNNPENTTTTTTITNTSSHGHRHHRRYLKKKEKEKYEGISFRSEHGPRAGRGYWEDLALAINARNGMISFHMFHRKHFLVRTSTALIREIIDFRKYIEYNMLYDYDNDNNDNDKKLQLPPSFYECTNPWKDKKKKKKKN
jgi:hypothetical protein